MTSFISHFVDIESASSVLSALESLTKKLVEGYIRDGNARDAIIDEVIEHLKSLKTGK